MEETIDCVVLEDGVQYAIIDEINTPIATYFYLANVNDGKDICIRKLSNEDGKEYLVGLDGEEEYKNALRIYYEKVNGK